MKRPSFQFYPADWRNNAKLRRCTEAARGVWMDILCVLHDSDEYGVCRWSLEQLARAAGARLSLVKELVEMDVLKGAAKGQECDPYIYTPRSGRKDGDPITLVPAQAGPIWYSSRFVRDEYKRGNSGATTRFTVAPKEEGPKAKDKNNDRARLRLRILLKTDSHCYHCGCGLDDVWEIDHLMPRSKGGRHTFDNMVPSCVRCNQDKADTLPDDWAALSSSPSQRQGERQGDTLDVHPTLHPSRAAPSSSSSTTLSKKETPIPPNPQEAARTQRDDYFRKCFDLITEKFPILTAQDTSHIYAWKRAGYDFDTQIKPIVDATPKNKAVRTFNYFTHVLNNLTEVKSAPPKPEPPPDLPKQTPEEKRVWYRKHGLHHAEFNPCAEKD